MFRTLISSAMATSSRESSHDGLPFARFDRAMSVVPRCRALGASLPLLAGLLAAAPAVPPEPPLSSFQDEVSVGLVLVPVVVRSGGGYAKNLDQKDFRLLVEGKPGGIASCEE